VLNRRYKQIEEFSSLPSEVIADIEQTLDKILDIERLWRRMSVGIMCPPELAGLNASYHLVFKLNDILKNNMVSTISDVLLYDYISDTLSEFTDTCHCIFQDAHNSLLTSNMDTVQFKKGIFKEIDKLYSDIKKEKQAIHDLADKISLYTDSNTSESIEYMQYSGYYIALNNMQTKKLKGVSDVHIKQNKAAARITSPSVDAANKKILILNEKLKMLTSLRYKTILQFLSFEYSCLTSVVKFVSEIDVIKSNWKTSKMYNYCRPEIVNSDEFPSESFVDAKDLRHPVIEQIDDGNEYVPNDVVIGKRHNGIILYSMNSCGKTSLMKALGLSVIMAQAGCFVSASSFSFYPFKCIMTRILSRDNFMKGQSSFVAEMSELRAILKRATGPSTLVLADEITHGTEHTSGSAIFVSSVEALAKRKVNFLFTTHLHNVYPLVRDIPNVRTLHLSVAFADNKIIFERKLKDGPGGSIYGLEVCEYLNMDTDFLARAFQLRTMITPDKTEREDSPIGKIKFNKYNKNKVKEICEVCGYYPRLSTDLPQSMADENGMVNGINIHAKSNLVVLCKKCHCMQHTNMK
jgi:DNA mismatch repair protein MutS